MVDSDALWSRLGLEELRQALAQVTALARTFEDALKALPPCDACARAALLQHIEASGRQLSGAAASLSTLAEMLEQARQTAERAQQELVRCAPESCACPPGSCTCGHS